MKNNAARKQTLAELDRLDAITKELFSKLSAYPIESLNQTPQAGVWSVMQILNHLLKSETGSLAYVKKKLSFDPNLKKAGLASWFRWIFIMGFLNSPFKFKAPKGVRTEDLPKVTDLAEVTTAFTEHRKLLRNYLEQVDDSRFGEEVYRHPIAGRLSLHQMAKSFTQHFRRHSKQIYQRLPVSSLALYLLSMS